VLLAAPTSPRCRLALVKPGRTLGAGQRIVDAA
jgi:hypothetical protein